MSAQSKHAGQTRAGETIRITQMQMQTVTTCVCLSNRRPYRHIHLEEKSEEARRTDINPPTFYQLVLKHVLRSTKPIKEFLCHANRHERENVSVGYQILTPCLDVSCSQLGIKAATTQSRVQYVQFLFDTQKTDFCWNTCLVSNFESVSVHQNETCHNRAHITPQVVLTGCNMLGVQYLW